MGFLRRHVFWTLEAARRRPTRAVVRDMAALEALGRAAFDEIRAGRLRAFCARVAEEVPYYRDLFADAGVAPDGVRRIADLARLPTLDKDRIRGAGSSLFHPGGGPFRLTETGGSTGDPLRIHESPLRQAVTVAGRIRSRAWFGIAVGDPELVLFGGAAERSARGLAHVLKDELVGSVTYSAFGMTPAHLDRVAARLRRVRPRHLFGYSSALCAFARHLREREGREDAGAGHGVEVIFTTSEMLLPADRALLAETFGAHVADGYGSKEAGFVSHECGAGRLHVRGDTHVVEIVEDGRQVPTGEPGEIVVTCLGDWHWPFLRYRTGDAGRLTGEDCPCGLPLPVLELTGGRITDLLVRADGGLVHGLGAIYPIRETAGVRRFQIHQRSLEHVDVRLVVAPGYARESDAEIARRLAETLGGPEVRIEHVDELAPQASGKYRVVVSDVPR